MANSYLDAVYMMGFGVRGYLFKKLELAIVIGDKARMLSVNRC